MLEKLIIKSDHIDFVYSKDTNDERINKYKHNNEFFIKVIEQIIFCGNDLLKEQTDDKDYLVEVIIPSGDNRVGFKFKQSIEDWNKDVSEEHKSLKECFQREGNFSTEFTYDYVTKLFTETLENIIYDYNFYLTKDESTMTWGEQINPENN